MATSKIDKVLTALKAERDVLDHAIAKIEAELAVKPATAKVRTGKMPRMVTGIAGADLRAASEK